MLVWVLLEMGSNFFKQTPHRKNNCLFFVGSRKTEEKGGQRRKGVRYPFWVSQLHGQ